MNRLLACLLAVAAAFPAAQAAAQQLQPIDRIVAVVDEDVVLRSELDRALGNVLSQYATRQDQLPPREVLEKQVLERLILVKLETARARSSGINVSDQEVDAALANIAQQNNIGLDQLGAQLARDGMTIADLRSSVRDEIAIQRLRQSFAQSRISVSEGEVDAALANQAAGNQYHLAHILVGLPEGATPDQIAAAQRKIEGIKAQLDRGEIDFAAAAVRYSDSPNALEGGDLGWRSLDEIPPVFAQAISSMQAGQILGPIRGASGFQLLQLVDTRDASAAAPRTVTQLQARHILVRAGEDGDAAAQAELETLRARIAGGADFAALAREHSEDTATADKGGELGWFAQDAYGPDFGAQVAALQDGQVSAPFKTQAGWHIVQREGARQVAAADDNRRQLVRESIGQRKLEEEWDRFLREMRGEAYVDIRLAETAAAPAIAAPPATAPADGD
ncbi:peptidylprolyl isomerase [Cognatiluteimonas weifangensis]|uniref:Chaperone SurA n=1 Tax=Cognatiluteimonas weifangensis TaxID=2303539 RepID=A0A372DJZ0_9GAMM|nr:peptidylprolyl isomerase [Luteimonas weifangensis]RFP59804.1 molecular chaperone SurA [Luteimonas weifangensis]